MNDVLPLVLIYLVVFPVVAIVAAYNKLVKSRNKVHEANSGLLVLLKKRSNLVYNLVEIVKAYSQHEYQTLVNVIKQRSAEGAVASFKAVAEAYPNLKADKQYQTLMQEFTALEDELADARLKANKQTRKYNDFCLQFPVHILAKKFNFKPEKYFELEESAELNAEINFTN